MGSVTTTGTCDASSAGTSCGRASRGRETVAGRSERHATVDREPLPTDGNVLLLAPSIGWAEREACTDFVGHGPLDITNQIHVLYVESPAARYEIVEEALPHHPAETAVVTVGSGDPVATRRPEPPHVDYHVESVADPGDLTGLGMALQDCLRAWQDDGYDVGLCFDSLSILLQYAEVERVYRFLHVLTRRLSTAGASAHFHLDPAAHDERTVARLSALFDSVVEVTSDGDRTVRK